MKLREYQRRAVANIGRCLADSPSPLLVLATGLGKTVCFAHAIAQHTGGGKRAMVLAHREELIHQNARTIEAVLSGAAAGAHLNPATMEALVEAVSTLYYLVGHHGVEMCGAEEGRGALLTAAGAMVMALQVGCC